MRIPILILYLFMGSSLFAQFPGCPSVDAGPDANTDCTNPCTDLVATPFDAGATTSYTAYGIPHNPPILYNEPGGNPISVGIDDTWSSAIALPFDFCFYGQTYTNCVVGSNGAIQFGTANAGGFHPWSFSASVPSAALVSAGNIFGPYHDIDPSVAGSGNVSWYLLGTAPCRIFVVSFNQIAHFSCTSLFSTHMMVLYETTNAIDVYIDNKATCGTWNSGNTVVGIQDMTGAQGIAAPGRNTGSWTVTTPEAWRFMPSGSPIYTVEWFENGNSIGTGDTVSVCPAITTTYTVEAEYTSCNGTIITETDNVTITPMNNGLTVTEINNGASSCVINTGSTEVSASGGTPTYTYSFDDTLNFQPSSVFTNLAPGAYTIYVKDSTGCLGAVVINITSGPTLAEIYNTPASCSTNTGTTEVLASGGTPGYTYSFNDTLNFQSSGLFTGLAGGTYTVYVKDSTGCISDVVVNIANSVGPTLTEVNNTATSCANNTGSTEVSASGGIPTYSYSFNDTLNFQSSPVFTGLGAGTYTVYVMDSVGCMSNLSITIDSPVAPILSEISVTNTTCELQNGELEVSGTGGVQPFLYSIDAGMNTQGSGIFTGLDAGVYLVQVVDSNLCIDTLSVIVNADPIPVISMSSSDTICANATDGDVSVLVVDGLAPYSYTVDAGVPQSIPDFDSLTAGIHTFEVTDSNGCTASIDIEIEVIPDPIIQNDTLGCYLGVQISGTESFNGGVWSAADTAIHFDPNEFAENPFVYTSTPGIYELVYTDNGCNTSVTMEVTFPPYVWASLHDTTLCLGVEYVYESFQHESIVNWDWNTGGTDTSILVTQPGVYSVTVSNVCHSATATGVIDYKVCDIEAPNIISLSSGVGNDIWFVESEGLSSFECNIVNRWGNSIYQFNDSSGGWDGKDKNGNVVSEGTYFYMIDAVLEGGEPLQKHGFIQVVH